MSGQNRRSPEASPAPATVGSGLPADGNQISPTAGSQQPSPTSPAGQGMEEIEKLKKQISDQQKEITRAQMEAAELKRQSTQKIQSEGQKALADAFSNYSQEGNAEGQFDVVKRTAAEISDANSLISFEMMNELNEARDVLREMGESFDVTPLTIQLARRVKTEYMQSSDPEIRANNCWLGAYGVINPRKWAEITQRAKMQGENEALGKASTASAGRIEKPGVPQSSAPPTADVKVRSLGEFALHKISTMKNAKGEPKFASFYKQ